MAAPGTLTAGQARERLRALPPGSTVGVATGPDGLGLAWDDIAVSVDAGPDLLRAAPGVRLVWWRAATTGADLVAAGVRPRACWDLAAVARLLVGPGREDPAATWAATHGQPLPPPAGAVPTLLDLGGEDPVAPDGTLDPDWARERPPAARAGRWAALALDVQQHQERALAGLPAPERALLTARAESAAALLAVELAADGLPLDRATAHALLAEAVGPPPADADDEVRLRRQRDARVHEAFGRTVDLRNPAAVKELLRAVGLDLADTRSWRLEPHRSTSPAVAALLDWRRAERLATTYGYGWLERCVGADGRLRGTWSAAEGAGRMTASNGLHSLPAAFRVAVRAEPGSVLVRADLGQVEPRVLAVVSGDAGLARAAREDDLYSPVAAALGCDRPTAKIAVLAAMYGQTSGTAGRALEQMRRAYPAALAFLGEAEAAGRDGGALRTWGGRRLPLGTGGHGRFARNAVVQGAAAELFKVWAVTVRAGLPALGSSARIVLCLHDELLLHVPAKAADAAVELLHGGLREAAGRWSSGAAVRFVAEVGVGERWSDAKA